MVERHPVQDAQESKRRQCVKSYIARSIRKEKGGEVIDQTQSRSDVQEAFNIARRIVFSMLALGEGRVRITHTCMASQGMMR